MTPDEKAAARALCQAGSPWQAEDARHPEAWARAAYELAARAPQLLEATLDALDAAERRVAELEAQLDAEYEQAARVADLFAELAGTDKARAMAAQIRGRKRRAFP